ncbi:uncharacterized protein LOC135839165 [Planococcus citri]|uniref:uncharacterized protein LOC135839165 n=1 Tax=Planococcus citri TaxID=170843 RepID=UPI0031F94052
MDWKANVKRIYAIGVVLIITNAASGVSGNKTDNSADRRWEPYTDLDCQYVCETLGKFCGCNMLKTTSGKFEHVFPITAIDGMLELKFKVKAERNAHLMFSTYKPGRPSLNFYSVLLGVMNTQYGNTNISTTTIMGGWDIHNVAEMESLLSPNEWREFWIQINRGSRTVKVGRKGENAFIELKNAPWFHIWFYSVATLGGGPILWNLPCIEEKDFSHEFPFFS